MAASSARRIRCGQYELAHRWAHVKGPPVLLREDDLTPLTGSLIADLRCPVCAAPAGLRRFEGQTVILYAHAPGCRWLGSHLAAFAGYRAAAGLPAI